MASLKRLPNPQMYTIGWIVALDKELTAANAVLDDVHQKPENFEKHPSDTNNYDWGRIGEHYVVIASLAAGTYGTVSAATTAACMRSSLPHLRFGLLVGIGAGIPRLEDKIDIRLGDIVVSEPNGTHSGVVQYDLGKLANGGQFKRVGSLDRPPEVVLKGLTKLKSKQRLGEVRVPKILDEIIERYPALAEAHPDDPAFVHQGTQNDRLFKASSAHVKKLYDARDSLPRGKTLNHYSVWEHSQRAWLWSFLWLLCSFWTMFVGASVATRNSSLEGSDDQEANNPRACADCDPAQELQRPKRPSNNPQIHYGVIASGNSVVKDGISRDELLQRLEDKCLCFEMEAAGLMNSFPCLVIRGICDYADTHKNDQWQNYAAATAAAFAKELLEVMDSEDVQRTSPIEEIRDYMAEMTPLIHQLDSNRHFRELEQWLSPPDPSTNYNKAIQQRHPGSGQWFLQHTAYSAWKTRENSFLWVNGIPGCGKTVLSSTIIEELTKGGCSQNILYFYFDFNDNNKKSLGKAVRSLIFQLYNKREDTRTYLDTLYLSYERGRRQPSTNSLSETFQNMVQKAGQVWIVLDALDECPIRKEYPNRGLLPWIANLQGSQAMNIHLLVTSRPEQDIESAIEKWACAQDIIPIQSNLITEDVHSYIKANFGDEGRLSRWRSRPEVQEEIENTLTEKAQGMFRWVSCQLNTLEGCLDYPTLRIALMSLPKTLDETYARILANIPDEHKHYTIRILQFLTYSERPLRIDEAVDAVAVDTENRAYFDPKNRMPEPKEISRCCSSLVVVVNKSSITEIQLAHFSVKEYLTSRRLDKAIAKDLEETAAKASIAKVCLAYLLESDKNLLALGLRRPLAQYSAQYWASHAAVAEGYSEAAGTLQKLQVDFFSNKGVYDTCNRLYNPDNPYAFANVRIAPPLYYASRIGLSHSVQILLDKGADPNAQGGVYGNPLQAASLNGHEKVVQMLLDKGADVNAQGGVYGNPLQAASLNGHEKVVQMLLDKGADVNAQGGVYGNPLQAASFNGHEKVVQMLLDKGADVNVQSSYWNKVRHRMDEEVTPLYAASSRGYEKVVQRLLAKGANVTSWGGEYNNALYTASFWGHEEVVQILLDHGTDVNIQGGYYGNPLYAAYAKGHKKVIRKLREKGATTPQPQRLR